MRLRLFRFAICVCGLGASAVLLLLSIGACGQSRLPAPTYVAQPTTALVEVPYPPPPARVEAVPKQPKDGAVWIDGEWVWQIRRWAWKPGRWVAPPSGARFSPWTSVRDRVGTLYLATGTWRDSSGKEVTDPDPISIAKASRTSLVDPEGDAVEHGPNVRLDAGNRGRGESGKDDKDAAAARASTALHEPLPSMEIDASASTGTMNAADADADAGASTMVKP